MCGIVAIAGPSSPDLLDRLNIAQRHRGPNDTGAYTDPSLEVSLAMRRLSILDPDGGHQPMSSADGTVWIVFNGEIFNAPQLRRQLEQKGRRFSTRNSDTEVLIHLYEEKGDAMLSDLNGMFAFVLLDRKARRLFGARDRFGIKPLYYRRGAGGVTFASEMKALLQDDGFEPRVNRQSVFHYLTLGYVPGADSILEGVRRVPPAHAFAWDLDRQDLSFRRYWSPRLDGKPGLSDDEAVDVLRESLGAAVERWSLSDVPVGCSLSGGLDSSMIAGMYSKRMTGRLKTYSLGFRDAGEDDELPLARKVANLFSTDHQELVLSADDLLKDLVPMVWHLDEPYGGGLPSWTVFQFMAREVRVGLTGTGGDELFGDYGKWLAMDRWPVREWTRRWRAGKPRGWTSLLGGAASPVAAHYMDRAYYLTDAEKRRSAFLDPRRLTDTDTLFESLFRDAPTEDIRDAATWVDLNTQLPDEFLLMTDRFSMAHSLEARTPFLDHEFVQTMLSIPADVRTGRRDLKRLLRRAARHMLPSEIVDGQKRGFVTPTAAWLRGPLRPLAERLLAPDRLRSQGLLNPAYYERLLAEHQRGMDHHKRIWFAVMFQLWHLVFIEERSRARPSFTAQDVVGAR